jgi:anaerobic magnesium-protoporphyrin IX monomethyl ester cyclase
LRIILIHPYKPEDIYGKFLSPVSTKYPPLGLAYLASTLEKQGHEVKICDLQFDDVDLQKDIESFNPDLVGTTATTPVVSSAYKILDEIREDYPKIKTAIGGVHASIMPEEALKHADIVVTGEADSLILNESCRGIIKCKPVINLNNLEWPARHLLRNKEYSFVDAKKLPVGTIMTSRGCPGRCVFCASGVMGNFWRPRDPLDVFDEMFDMVCTHGIREIHVLDENWCLDEKRAIGICDLIIDRGLDHIPKSIANGQRVDKTTDNLMSKMRDAGFYSVSFGFESGNQGVLDACKKGITLKQSITANNFAKRYGFEVWGFFMLGLPGDTKESMQDTIDFAKMLDCDVSKFFVTTPLPGTELYDEWIVGDVPDWGDFKFYDKPIFNHPNLSKEDIVEYNKKAFREFYFNPWYILKSLRRINSFHRLKNFVLAGLGLLLKNFV